MIGYCDAQSGDMFVRIRSVTVPFAAAVVIFAATMPGQAQIVYNGKSVTLFAGQPPGGGIDSEMRLVAHFLGRFIPGEPTIVPRNIPGAGGLLLGNYLY